MGRVKCNPGESGDVYISSENSWIRAKTTTTWKLYVTSALFLTTFVAIEEDFAQPKIGIPPDIWSESLHFGG